MIESSQKSKGSVKVFITYKSGETKDIYFNNTVLNDGKAAVVKTLAGEIGSSFVYYVCKMVFGSNGTVDGVAKYVDATRDGLFGPVVVSKNVVSTINPANSSQVVFTATLTFDDAVDSTINEIALQLADDSYYSMATFGDITKTSDMQIVFQWQINFV